ncbi:MAG: hypothetical protein R3B84_12825 [Zavarzinella sp.]
MNPRRILISVTGLVVVAAVVATAIIYNRKTDQPVATQPTVTTIEQLFDWIPGDTVEFKYADLRKIRENSFLSKKPPTGTRPPAHLLIPVEEMYEQ